MNRTYPHMIYEVIDAIHLMYEDHPDVETDCMLYLKNVLTSDNDLAPIEKWFEDKNKCSRCGSDFTYYEYTQYHGDEIGSEVIQEVVCPNCDTGGARL